MAPGQDILSSLRGESAAFRAAIDQARLAGASTLPVLITGETGVGKTLLARVIHQLSGRPGPLVVVNCAAIPAPLFEAELFGHAAGAFTGAEAASDGLFARADGGTLLLDELGELDLALQPKLLRALEDGQIRRVGETSERRVDVRLIGATNQDLEALIEQRAFRADLLYRVGQLRIELPPLRERPEDLPALIDAALAAAAEGAPARASAEARRELAARRWPGNVRELFAAVAAGMARARLAGSRGGELVLEAAHLPPARGQRPSRRRRAPSAEDALADPRGQLVALYREGRQQAVDAWADFFLAFAAASGRARLRRAELVELLGAARDASPSALTSEWQRRLKPVPIDAGLIAERNRWIEIDLEACRAAASGEPSSRARPRPRAPRLRDARPLPPAPDHLVGRQRELAQIGEALVGPGLVTLVGPGGVGKTSLALALAHAEPDGGARWIDLTEADDATGAVGLIVRRLGGMLSGSSADLARAIGTMLAMHGGDLLVLDNAEHIAGLDRLLDAALTSAPQARVLVTSQRALGLSGERAIGVPPLPLPEDDPGAWAANPCVQLLRRRAGAQLPDAPSDEQLRALATLGRELEGLPLALDLVARRLALFDLDVLQRRAPTELDLLATSDPATAPRHRSLRAVLDWSLGLLEPPQRAVLDVCVRFRGGFRPDDVAAVMPDPPALDALYAILEELLARGLLQQQRRRGRSLLTVAGPLRLRLLELDDDAELTAAHARWTAAQLEAADRRAPSDLAGALDQLERLTPDALATMAWAEANRDAAVAARVATACTLLHEWRGPRERLLQQAQLALALEPAAEPASRLLITLARHELRHGGLETAAAHVERARQLGGDEGDPAIGLALAEAWLARRRLEPERERRRAAFAYERATPDSCWHLSALVTHARALIDADDDAVAPLLDAAVARAGADTRRALNALSLRAEWRRQRGQPAAAAADLEAALGRCADLALPVVEQQLLMRLHPLRLADDPAAAAPLIERIEGCAAVQDDPAARALAACARARQQLAEGNPDAAARACEAARAELAGTPHRPTIAAVTLTCAAMLRAAGDANQAEALLARAIDEETEPAVAEQLRAAR